MAKMTLLEMVQNILSAMDSDEVNSIGDTVEALQVAEVVRETYDELFSNVNAPSHDTLVQLEPLSDVNRPNYLRLQDAIKEIKWIKYDYRTDDETDYQDIEYLSPESFLQTLINRRGQGSTTEITDFSGAKLYVFNDANPTYWTTFDNEYIVFDSFNSEVESSLQASKSLAWGQVHPAFNLDDDFIPDLDAELFPMFLAEAKSVCFLNFKQSPSPKEEQRVKRQRVRNQNNRWRMNQRKYDGPNYGRRSRA